MGGTTSALRRTCDRSRIAHAGRSAGLRPVLSGGQLSQQAIAQRVPAYAARLLAPREGVRYLTRRRWVGLDFLGVMAAVVLALVVYSVLVEPGFIRLLALPALPFLGSFAAALTLSPVILVTDLRVVFARRFSEPVSLGLERLRTIRLEQKSLGRLLGYGKLLLLIEPPPGLDEGVFSQITLTNLPDAASLGSAISAAAGALGIEVAMEESQ